MSSPGEYDVDKVKRLITEMERLLGDNVQFDKYSADLVIRNLVAGLRNAVQTIEFIQGEIEFERRSRMSTGVKSDERH